MTDIVTNELDPLIAWLKTVDTLKQARRSMSLLIQAHENRLPEDVETDERILCITRQLQEMEAE